MYDQQNHLWKNTKYNEKAVIKSTTEYMTMLSKLIEVIQQEF